TTYLILIALFAALTGICSWISIPLPFTPVPIALATLVPTLAGGLLGPRYGTISMVVYLLLGGIGAPVFHNFTGGLGILAGPTGGYLVGYITSALICGLILSLREREKERWLTVAEAAILGHISCYVLGTGWFMLSTGTGLISALVLCVIPFLVGDALKLILSVLLIKKLRPLLV
ncbi:MAG: biotin transporter BioY, partial [Anaerovoracaceae bacterium]